MRALFACLITIFLMTFVGCKATKDKTGNPIAGTTNRGGAPQPLNTSEETGPGSSLTNGTGSRGGSDNVLLQQKAAWFTGVDQKIDICFEASEAFTENVTSDQITDGIKWAFDKWGNYIEAKGINDSLLGADAETRKIGDPKLKLTTDYQLHTNCDAVDTIDLKFFFGVDPKSEIEPQSAIYETAAAESQPRAISTTMATI